MASVEVGCVFCDIVGGRVAQPLVLETGDVVAFMDLRQPRDGHVLVVPRRHLENVYDVDEVAGSAIMAAVVRVARALREAFEPEGLSLWQSNGPGAHQEVPHFHMHLMPRWGGDGLLRVYPERPRTPVREELERQAATIRAKLR